MPHKGLWAWQHNSVAYWRQSSNKEAAQEKKKKEKKKSSQEGGHLEKKDNQERELWVVKKIEGREQSVVAFENDN